MSTPPSSSTREAQRALGARLREIRKDAGLSGRALAAATGQHFTRVSKIEHGVQPPTDEDIRGWCAACGAQAQVPDLIATRPAGGGHHTARIICAASAHRAFSGRTTSFEDASRQRLGDSKPSAAGGGFGSAAACHLRVLVKGDAMLKEARIALLLAATACLLAVMVDWVIEELSAEERQQQVVYERRV